MEENRKTEEKTQVKKGTVLFRVIAVILSGLMLFTYALAIGFKIQAEHNLPVLALFVLLLGTALFCFYRTGLWLWKKTSFLQKKLLIAAVSFIFLFLQFIVARALYGTVAHDFHYLFKAGNAVANGSSFGDCADYFAQFPNNSFLMLCFAFLFRVCNFFGVTNYMPALIGVNVLVVDITIVFSVLCAKKMFGNKTAGLYAILLMGFLGLHRGIVLPYSDTFCMPFPILCLFLYLHLPEKGIKRFLMIGGMALSFVIGYKIKPQTVILIVALGLAAVCYRKPSRKRLKKVALTGFCFFLTSCITLTCLDLLIDRSTAPHISQKLKAEREIPFTHFLMMGLNDETQGFFSGSDYTATLSYPTKSGKIQFNLQEIRRRLQAFGISGYGSFLFQKSKAIYADGNMDMWIREPFSQNDALCTGIRSFLYQSGENYAFYKQFLQAMWIILFGFMILPILFHPAKNTDFLLVVLRLAVLSLAAFLLLFEGGPRYLFHQMPFFCMLAAWGMLHHNIGNWWKSHKPFKRGMSKPSDPPADPRGTSGICIRRCR